MQGLCRTSPPPNETSITINLRAGATKSCSANRYGASQFGYWYPDKTNPRRRCNLKVFVVNTFSMYFQSLLVKGLQRRPGAGKSWRRDSVCSRCQPSNIERRSGARQWRDFRVSWQLLFDSLSVNLLSEAWDTLHDDPVSLSQSWYCAAFGRTCHSKMMSWSNCARAGSVHGAPHSHSF